jgi:hypothetical protein
MKSMSLKATKSDLTLWHRVLAALAAQGQERAGTRKSVHSRLRKRPDRHHVRLAVPWAGIISLVRLLLGAVCRELRLAPDAHIHSIHGVQYLEFPFCNT